MNSNQLETIAKIIEGVEEVLGIEIIDDNYFAVEDLIGETLGWKER